MFTHLTVLLDHHGTLFHPIALDYIKALQLLFAQKHHLESIDPSEWEALVKFCFAALFEESLGPFRDSSQKFTEAEGRGKPLFSGQRDHSDGESNNGGSDADSGDEGQFNSASERKRKRDRTRGQSSSEIEPTQRGRAQSVSLSRSNQSIKRAISLETIALASLLHTLLLPAHSLPLLKSTLTPLYDHDDYPLSAEPSFVATGILYNFLRYLLTYPSETSAHLDVLKSINIILNIIQLNQISNMKLFSMRLFPVLAKLWSETKSKELREQILIGWRWIFPFLSKVQDKFGKEPAWESWLGEAEERNSEREVLGTLLGALESEAGSRWGNESLILEGLKLGFRKKRGQKRALVAGSFSVCISTILDVVV